MKPIIGFFRGLYLPRRFFLVIGFVAIVFVCGFVEPVLFTVGQTVLLGAIAFSVVDCLLLFPGRMRIEANRITPRLLNLGDENTITIVLYNLSGQPLSVKLIDELPIQFQERDFSINFLLSGGERKSIEYPLKPLSRGSYDFGNTHVYAKSVLGLLARRVTLKTECSVPVYPSILQMKKYELIAFSNIQRYEGVKRIRRLGHSYEFEQIKPYVKGDDYRSVNWKATSRRSELMVNQYEDEKSQQIYSVIDKSRAMRMPFNGLSLLDYSINTSLVISNIALRKHDKSGLLTFSDKLGSTIRAEKGKTQLRKIMESLYREEERQLEANYELLYLAIRNMIRGRSLLFLYSNFESLYAMERVLPILRKINAMHLLVVMIFENTEVRDFGEETAKNTQGVYFQTIARNQTHEKRHMVQELRRAGIQTLLTDPEDLSMNTVNKYLELKSRGLI